MKKTVKAMLVAVALLSGAARAEEVSEAQARTVAENFVAKDSIGMGVLPGRTVDAVTRRGGFYLVTLKPSGHVFVSVNRSAEPIPVFSEHDFVVPGVGSPQEAFLAAYETNAINATGLKYESRWRTLLGERRLRLQTANATATDLVNIPPMVTSVWGQNYPYNMLTPVVNKSHTPVGCVGTAYAQILWYWRWPEVLNEDVESVHAVKGKTGHAWRLKAGTEFDWESMPEYEIGDDAMQLKLSRGSMFSGMLAGMEYNSGGSAALTKQPGINKWFTPYKQVTKSQVTQDEMNAAMRQSLLDGCPFMVSINTHLGSHAVVGDGWQENADGTKYVHLNYGWQDSWTNYGSVEGPLDVFVNQKPKPMVQNKPIPMNSKLPFTVEWAFPTKGYKDVLTRFDVTYTEVSGETTDWVDNMENSKGEVDGDLILVDDIGDEAGKVLRIRPEADKAYYTWPTVVATKETVFSYRVHSRNARDMSVEIQLLDPSVGWSTISTPELIDSGLRLWSTVTIPLAAYEGKGIAIRVMANRKGLNTPFSDVNDKSVGVQLDDITLTNVRQPFDTVAGTIQANAEDRLAVVNDTALKQNTTYLFQVTPKFNDATVGISGYPASCTIAASNNAKPTITAVTSVVSTAPAVKDNLLRTCYFGLNQFGVYGTSAMTDLEVHLSCRALIDEVEEPDAAVSGAYIKGYQKIPVEDSRIEIGMKSPGNFLVRIDMSGFSTFLTGTRMIMTLIARNDQGDVDQKDVLLYFSSVDNEPRIEVANLPENGGTVIPDEPDPVYYTVTFDSQGGSEVVQRTRKSGEELGALETPTKDGYAFAGWFTDATDGDQIDGSELVTQNVTYYAHWTAESSGGDDPGEDPDDSGDDPGDDPTEDDEETPVVTPTFPKADGAGPNDDTTAKTRFCPGVTGTASGNGWYDVARQNTFGGYIPPVAQDLVKWWAARYTTVEGASPAGYTAIDDASLPTSDTGLTLVGYVGTLLSGCTVSASYFPAATESAADWSAHATDTKDVAAGRRIYEALANGPIGFCASTSSKYYGVIWGCKYATDATGNYATTIYFTSTKSKNDNKVESSTLGVGDIYDSVSTGSLTMPSYASGMNAVFDFFYPISAPEPESSGDGEVTVKVTAGGREFDISKAFSKVEKGADSVVAYTLDATPGKKIEVDGEEISIQPELADGEDETPFEVQEGKLVFRVKSIPGLKYQVLASDSLDPDSFAPAGKEREAISTRRELTVTRSGETKGFYKIQVSR